MGEECLVSGSSRFPAFCAAHRSTYRLLRCNKTWYYQTSGSLHWNLMNCLVFQSDLCRFIGLFKAIDVSPTYCFFANVARHQIDCVRRFAGVASFYCGDCPRFWFECLCNRYQSACLTTWCIAQPWLRFGTVLSGFDLCPDEDVFEAFWSSECYHWFLRENASSCQCLTLVFLVRSEGDRLL